VTGLASYLLDPDDPFPAGFLLGPNVSDGASPSHRP
jgi:proline racemase